MTPVLMLEGREKDAEVDFSPYFLYKSFKGSQLLVLFIFT